MKYTSIILYFNIKYFWFTMGFDLNNIASLYLGIRHSLLNVIIFGFGITIGRQHWRKGDESDPIIGLSIHLSGKNAFKYIDIYNKKQKNNG